MGWGWERSTCFHFVPMVTWSEHVRGTATNTWYQNCIVPCCLWALITLVQLIVNVSTWQTYHCTELPLSHRVTVPSQKEIRLIQTLHVYCIMMSGSMLKRRSSLSLLTSNNRAVSSCSAFCRSAVVFKGLPFSFTIMSPSLIPPLEAKTWMKRNHFALLKNEKEKVNSVILLFEKIIN